jgi:hypothetical protein
VGGNFDCYRNRLTSLTGAPREVKGDFNCSFNTLSSLAEAPRKVGGGFYCYSNGLTSLAGAPREVEGNFYCENNELTSLAGAPREVGGHFNCSYNELTSLKGAPQTIGGQFKSDEVKIPKGQWGFKSWLDVYATGNAQARRLLLTLMSPDAINQRMQEEPEQTLIDLGPIWNDPAFDEIRSQVRVPDRYRYEMGLLGDLGELGFWKDFNFQ